MNETPDRISELPDSILSYILSFIPTRNVVQTSILSRRWRYIWTSMSKLDFDDSHFPFMRFSPTDVNTRFVNFVDMVLQFHDISDIQKFRLSFFDCDFSRVNTWIDVAVKHNVQELYIDTTKNYFQFSDRLFTCKSLVSLKFRLYLSNLQLPDSICFTSLRTLHLDTVVFRENCLIPKLLSSCPILENLVMIGCGWGLWRNDVVQLCAPTVRNFSLDGSRWGINGDHYLSDRTIKISIPNLTSLKYIDLLAKDYDVENHPSLVDAYIDVKVGKTYWGEMYDNCGYRVTKLLRGFSSARCLTLSHFTLELLSNALNLLDLLPTFQNLNKLILTAGRIEMHFLVITCLLQRCPVLESLEIDIEPSPIYEYQYVSEEGLEYEGLVLDHLKEVTIRCFGRTEDELEFVKLLLGSARNMKRLSIIEGEDSEKITEIIISK